MSNIIGIDLGTTFSCVAHLDPSGRPTMVLNADEKNITPSCIYFGEKVEVGEEARRAVGQNDENAKGRFKRDMGKDVEHTVAGNKLTPTDLSALVLKKLKKDTESKIGDISEAVITVPASFGHKGRTATKEAAEQAGFKVDHIIDEPTAAALYYAFTEADIGGTYAVYDLGGGTFDISLIEISGQEVQVLGSEGHPELGGIDFDEALQKLVFAKYKKMTKDTLKNEDWDLSEVVETKKSLSKRDKVKVRINRVNLEVTRSEFEEAISNFIAQTELMCAAALKKSQVAAKDVKGLFLVGGSTRIPLVKNSASKAFGGLDPIATANVDEVVALGASLYAAYKGDRTVLSPLQRASVENIEFNEVTHKYLGTVSMGYNDKTQEDMRVNSIVLERGRSVPCSESETFFTRHDGQTGVNLTVTESGIIETDPEFVDIIWEGSLALPPGRPAGQEIEVTYSYDTNKIFIGKFKDVSTGKLTEISLDLNSSEGVRGGKSSSIEEFEVE